MRPSWIPLGLLILGAEGGGKAEDHRPHTVIDVTTIYSTTKIPVTHYFDVNITRTSTTWSCVTKYTTTTLYFTVSATKTDLTTITNTKTDLQTVVNTKTEHQTITNTKKEEITITNTKKEEITLTNTKTETTTVLETVAERCPKSCTVSAGTVTLFFWPTDRPHSYPPTYVHPTLDYTFTSPSVYMLIDTARGTNTRGEPAGPSTASWMLPLNLDEVSTILSKSLTRQLTLSDLGTDCPQTADPTAIATMLDDPRCNPILAAPRQVSTWAFPCNACGRFGLFDPPYAVPTLPGGLVVTTAPPPVVTTPPPAPTLPPVSTTTTARISPIQVPGSAARVTSGLLGGIPAVLIAVLLF